jgi:hypothetical protein
MSGPKSHLSEVPLEVKHFQSGGPGTAFNSHFQIHTAMGRITMTNICAPCMTTGYGIVDCMMSKRRSVKVDNSQMALIQRLIGWPASMIW